MLLFTAPRDALLAPLQSVSGIVEKRHTLPILSNVLIEKKGDALTLLATDIEIQIRNRTTAAVGAEDVAITVGARKLQDILRALPDTADVSLTLDDKRITLKAGKSRFQLQTLPAADYPRLSPPEGEGISFTTTQKAFKKQLALVQYAMAQQDIRYYLNGLLLVVAGNLLRMVATDGHRLAYAASPLVGDYARTDVILPRKTVVELARQLADSDDPLEVTLVGNQIEGAGQPRYQNVQRCNTETYYENRTVGYNVVYEYAGRQYSTQTSYDPGNWIPVSVQPSPGYGNTYSTNNAYTYPAQPGVVQTYPVQPPPAYVSPPVTIEYNYYQRPHHHNPYWR